MEPAGTHKFLASERFHCTAFVRHFDKLQRILFSTGFALENSLRKVMLERFVFDGIGKTQRRVEKQRVRKSRVST
ncbi:hypothetical protein LMIY3S_03553 [Labrys miyagiensis]